MKDKSLLTILLLTAQILFAHKNPSDSLLEILSNHREDAAEVDALVNLASISGATKYATEGLSVAEKIHYTKGKADCLLVLASNTSWHGNYGPTLRHTLDALSLYKELKDNTGIASAHLMLQGLYRDIGDYTKSIAHAIEGEQIAEANKIIGKFAFPGHQLAPFFLGEIAQGYVFRNQLDSASFYTQKAIDQKETFNDAPWNFPFYLLATIQTMHGEYRQALKTYHLSASLARQNGIERDVLQNFSGISTLFKKTGQSDSAIYYAQSVAHSTLPDLEPKNLQEALDNLAELYRLTGEKDSTIKYMSMSYHLRDSMFNREKDREVQGITFGEELKQQEILTKQAKFKSRIQLYTMAAGLLVLLLVALLLWRNNLQKQKAKVKIEKAYSDLKSTQAQLIHSEKMASLGELTAGVAHEIQNPLNFVNNFSDVNKELLTELNEEIERGNLSEAKMIAKDVIENEIKINHHGKRADAIVKGMLQHSRSSSGIREPTDINGLCDEYLRLAYHGLRAKEKTFNATIETDFDDRIGKINIVAQDIGRVILNLINNAFYAVNEKAKLQSASGARLPNGQGYEPRVIVSTRKTGDKALIIVKDNGNGIAQNIVDKIFQPFFTTKPTGQGTGLGLSLAYDIVKAHGGEIKVKTREASADDPRLNDSVGQAVGPGEGSEFIIQLKL